MREAMFYKKSKDGVVQCELCPRFCSIKEGEKGFCRARKNVDGKLYAITYAKPCSIAIDPIEKKPFYHFYPGSSTLSIATYGCNFSCDFCQNWGISQADIEKSFEPDEVLPEQLVEMALENNCGGISYTYTEPTIFYEYCFDTAKIAHKKGLYNCFVSNGYINEMPLKEISKYLDANNVDLKGTDEFYKKICHAPAGIKPVQETIKNCHKFGIHVEVTNLIVPGLNDNDAQIKKTAEFVKNVSDEIPLYFSRFYPQHKMLETPQTDVKTLEKAHEIAKKTGLKYVYAGNVPGHKFENTYCPDCNYLLIKRFGFSIEEIGLTKDKKCPSCGEKILIIN